jgi:phosphoglycolate phosphatase-like HAD superfamily hydrolase
MHGYKKLYNDELLAMVRRRLDKLRRGELESADFQIKGALTVLRALHARGVKLYLASGTDQADVACEAETLGYAGLFEGRIFGAVGDLRVEAKRVVLERIFQEVGLAGSAVVTFGDGPVEMRETRKRDGIAVGVASDEVRRFGLSPTKRSRLIRAGADLIVPDFSQHDKLLAALFPEH